jgi:hypothetical protein
LTPSIICGLSEGEREQSGGEGLHATPSPMTCAGWHLTHPCPVIREPLHVVEVLFAERVTAVRELARALGKNKTRPPIHRHTKA